MEAGEEGDYNLYLSLHTQSFESTRKSHLFFLFFLPGVDVSHVYVGARLLPLPYWYSNLSEGVDRVGGQLRGDRVPLQWRLQPNLAEFGGRCRKSMLGLWKQQAPT